MAIKFKKITDKKSFTIIRSKWARGCENGQSKLLNYEGNMCCLGQYLKSCGATDDMLLNNAEPSDLDINPNLGKAWAANLNQTEYELIDFKTKLVDTYIDDDKKYMINTDNTYNLIYI